MTISWDEINNPRIDEKLRQQEALAGASQELQMLPVADHPQPARASAGLWYNTLVYMTLFGLLGGMLGWACGEVLHFRPNARTEAREWIDARRQILQDRNDGRLTESQADAAILQIDRVAQNNPYYAIEANRSLSEIEKGQRRAQVAAGEEWDEFVANVLFYSIAGMMIAMCLAMAEAMVQRNAQAAIINGSVGAILGLAGGIAAAFCVDRVFRYIEGDPAIATQTRQILARAGSWAVLGLFLSIAPGLVMRNGRKFFVGMVGGLVGGVVGGVLYEFIAVNTGNAHLSRLVGVVMIGAIAGFGTGLIENVVKSGWLKVSAGLIAGKQFVLYRNPTYIGSSLQCAIYLFKDPQVGRRHAAVHIVPGGYEIEDLPLGGQTLINGRPVQRTRLRNNDRIQIGATTFTFQEKPKAAAAG
ncbi:MAG: FHA domain-containing protein [Phycisphaerales bacterium]|jgi:hypothetical protein|nr:FHA domain-containing protein [Phycisphaerales bacterium]